MILDVFTSIFVADTAGLKKGYDEAVKGSKGVTAEMEKAEDQGVRVQDILIKAMEALGLSADGAKSTFSSLSDSMVRASAETGSEVAQAFKSIGVSVNDAEGDLKSAVDMLQEIASAVDGMDVDQARAYLSTIGIADKSMVEAILKGKDLNRVIGQTQDEMKKAEIQSQATGESMIEMAKKAMKFLATAVATGKSIGSIVNQAEIISAMSSFADAIDSSIEDVDAFGKTLVALGSSKDVAEASLESLFSSITKASKDSGSQVAIMFKNMGVGLRDATGGTRDLFDVLMDVSGAVEKMDSKKAREYIQAIGITDRATIEAMIKGREELERLMRTQKELGVINKESAEKAIAFDKSMGALSNAFSRSKRSIAEVFMPALMVVIDGLTALAEWSGKNKEIVVALFSAIAVVVMAAYVPAMASAAIATLAVTWPILLLIAALAMAGLAIWALWDDFQAFKKGSDSFIGALMERYPALGKAIVGLFKAIGTVVDWVGILLVKFGSILGIAVDGSRGIIYTVLDLIMGMYNSIFEWLGRVPGLFKDGWDKTIGALKVFKDSFIGVFESIWDKVEEIIGFITGAVKTVTGAVSKVASKLGFGSDEEEGITQRSPSAMIMGNMSELVVARAHMAGVDANPYNNVTSSQIQNAQTKGQSITTTVEVNGLTVVSNAMNADDLARDAVGSFERQLKDLAGESMSGVAR